MKKPKLTISNATKAVQLGASGPHKPPNPLMAEGRKDYKKAYGGAGSRMGKEQEQVNVSFGQTGLTGES
jgi:hypothetical protein